MAMKVTKIDNELMHIMPFSGSRKREKGYSIDRVWGKKHYVISSYETLNHTDMIVFFQIINDFLSNQDQWIPAGDVDGTPLIKREFSINALTHERLGNTNQHNRKTTLQSIDRIKSITLRAQYSDSNFVVDTWYFHKIEADRTKFTKCVIVANKHFIEYCIRDGIRINYGRLIGYGNNSYSAILDAFLQSNKNKNFGSRNYYSEETIKTALQLDKTNMTHRDIHYTIQEAFNTIHIIGGMPKYVFIKATKRWCLENYLESMQ